MNMGVEDFLDEIKIPAPIVEFDSVDEDYYWGSYGDFKVLIMKDNGYINASKLCTNGDKKLIHWMENQTSRDLIVELSTSIGIPIDQIIIKKMTGSNEFRGTYVHLHLVPHIACWVSAVFALKVSTIVNEYLLKEEKARHCKEIEEKDNAIKELKDMMANVLQHTGDLLRRNENLETSVDAITSELSNVHLDNEITHELLEQTNETLLEVVENRVVKTTSLGTLNTVAIYEDKDPGTNKSHFHIFRTQRSNLSAALRKYLKTHPNATEFYRIEYNPNAVNFYLRIKQRYDARTIKTVRNDFELLGDTKREQLFEYLQEIENEKRVV
ncbi:hypothetical protein BGX26_000669 [Mortierella sp. AD094]|nr:hypothetical protein BGX26_000669 [Mortierella sp. AD094]